MLDSEGSAESIRASENSAAREETVSAMPNLQSTNGDKLEEFEKLIQSMLPSRTPSQEEEEPEENETEKKIGLSFLQLLQWIIHYFIL
ncbi:hypothetical protein K0M31_009360 [Melipona bicolor]|uniref:Uncharacterized protein n=1 Tax=Melipona bicolor TaxID=60889 RepID=A0AA40FQ31_9HYME|nr:hypothetical protein K0M31_009360 [Melipona bicolor]